MIAPGTELRAYKREWMRAYRATHPRPDVKGSRRRCSTPGCPHTTQTEDPRCSECREGRKTFRRFAREDS